jgi:hypothetical protein
VPVQQMDTLQMELLAMMEILALKLAHVLLEYVRELIFIVSEFVETEFKLLKNNVIWEL